MKHRVEVLDWRRLLALSTGGHWAFPGHTGDATGLQCSSPASTHTADKQLPRRANLQVPLEPDGKNDDKTPQVIKRTTQEGLNPRSRLGPTTCEQELNRDELRAVPQLCSNL